MKQSLAKQTVTDLAKLAGITINGNQPWDVKVHNEDFYERVLRDGDLGLGESYMEGWWDCDQLEICIEKVLEADLESKLKTNPRFAFKLFLSKFINFQTKTRSQQVAKEHYDLGNDLYSLMLDKNMQYSCGYWKDAKTLDEAQIAKMDLICRKLYLKPGMRLLDIGCGWGYLAKYAAEKYGVSVVGINISVPQIEFARENCKNLPVEIRVQDYRDVNEKFDRVTTVGMIEHVGHLNYRAYMEVVNRCLKDDGMWLLHTIGRNQSDTHSYAYIDKYIFPNGMCPSIAQLGRAAEKLLVMEDWHNFGVDYSTTLLAWHKNLNQHWNKIKHKYDEKVLRMFNFYLASCASGFASRQTQLWQIVFSKNGIKGGYESIR